MSDEVLEQTETQPEVTETPEPQPRVEGDEVQPPSDSQPTGGEGSEITPGPNDPKWYVKKIGKLTARLRETERRLESLHGSAAASRPPEQVEFPKPKPIRPQIEQFDGDLDRYGEALANHSESVTQWTIEKIEHEQKVRQRAIEYNEAALKREQLSLSRQAEAEAKYEDFQDVIDEAGLRHNKYTVIVDALMDSDKFADMSYFLAKNQKELNRIAALSPYGQVREIGKLEAKLMAQEEIKQKEQKPQPTPVERGGTGVAPKSSEKLNAQRDFERAVKTGDFTEYIYKHKKLG